MNKKTIMMQWGVSVSIWACLTGCLAVICLVGCWQPMGFPKEISESARAVATSMTDQAIWDKISASTDGHVINPGMQVSAGIKYVVEARIVGADADLRLGAEGAGSGVQTEQAQALIREILSDGSQMDPAVRAILERLLDRTAEPPPPDEDQADEVLPPP